MPTKDKKNSKKAGGSRGTRHSGESRNPGRQLSVEGSGSRTETFRDDGRYATAPTKIGAVKSGISFLTKDDLYLFNEGSHLRLYEKLGAHPTKMDNQEGTYFSVWAPNADEVSVIGDFNGWKPSEFKLFPSGQSGIWEGFIPGVKKGTLYKYHIWTRGRQQQLEKADPYAFYAENPPKTASVVWDLDYKWNDQKWMSERKTFNASKSPVSVYEVHLGSWMRVPEEKNRRLTYKELANKLTAYVKEMGFTHVEFMPIMEHPFYGSWGYQVTGYFSPTSRYGNPQDFRYLIDQLHQNGIGVILDWVPSHYPTDGHGLGYFDGTKLYEHEDPRKGFHPDWNSLIFNYGRHEVKSFLMSNAMYWFDQFHIDGLRVDAVASMLYLDYSRKEGEWVPNKFGGKENIEAIQFLRRLNLEIYKAYPDAMMIAEESTSWPMVSRPTYVGGLGFGMKWDMGWMHDTLKYMSLDPIFRKFNHNSITFRMMYAFAENFVLSLSHDEVVYGKRSFLEKMPGDDWQKFANLRLLFGYMYTMPGKKHIFMGGELGQRSEWSHNGSLDWHLLQHLSHQGVKKWVKDLNDLYKNEPALHGKDWDPAGFEWIDLANTEQSILCFLRKGERGGDDVLVALNFTPLPRHNYLVGVPRGGFWKELLNSDAAEYGGGQQGNFGGVPSTNNPVHGQPFSVNITIPSLGLVILKRNRPYKTTHEPQ
jgi:1,4-alpha-glucan branching enzyme